MADRELTTIHGTPALVLSEDGPPLDTIEAATEMIGDAAWGEVELVVIPAVRLTDDFFELRTGFAGEVTQKYVNYRLRLAIIGDISTRVADSVSLAAWVAESNRGEQLWFEPDHAALERRLRV